MKSFRKVIKAPEVRWGAAVTLKAPMLPPPSPDESDGRETGSSWHPSHESGRPQVDKPGSRGFQVLQMEPGSGAFGPGPAVGTQELPAEVEAEQARLLQAAQAQAAEIERAARAKAAEIEQLARAQSAEFERLADEQAQEVVRVAKEQAAEVTRQARREGYEAAEGDAGQLLLAAQGVLDEVRAWRTSMFDQSEQAILDLVAHIAKVIFGEGVNLPREVLESAFSRALTEARPLGNLRVRVNPGDAAILSPAWAQRAAPTGQRLELVPDENVRRGGCLVEGENGVVDARVDTQLQLVLTTLAPKALPTEPERTGASPT